MQKALIKRTLPLGLSVLAFSLLSSLASAQVSRSAIAINGVNNYGYIYALDQQWTDGSTADVTTTKVFTGMDRNGVSQDMTFNAHTVDTSSFGTLHCYASASLFNSYYNVNNPDYTDVNGNLVNPNGSPSHLDSLGFASFSDTLAYGGLLGSGYKARYIFHADGTNSGTGGAADLGVNVDGNPGNSFFDFGNGPFSEDWATDEFDINGTTPQQINVQFSNQVVFNTEDLVDGQDVWGESNFSATVKLTGIQVFDANGNIVTGWTVTSGSGAIYPVPEPATWVMMLGVLGPICAFKVLRSRA